MELQTRDQEKSSFSFLSPSKCCAVITVVALLNISAAHSTITRWRGVHRGEKIAIREG